MKLLKVDTIKEVKDKLEKYFGPASTKNLRTDEIQLFDAAGRYLAENITADADVPGYNRSVVDGYAVKAADTFGVSDSSPVFLEAITAVDMGANADFELKAGQTSYVPTGGMLPRGADAMVMVEYAEILDEKTIAIYKPASPNLGVMKKGDDIREGKVIYKIGHKISTNDIGTLAACGFGTVTVFEKPHISIISTGDEVVSVFEEPAAGQVRDINSYTLCALARETGAVIDRVCLARDRREEIRSALQEALMRSDIVIISGGSSAGNKDMTAEIIGEVGKPGVFTHGIAMKPGKPTIIGALKNEKCCCNSRPQMVCGLPGHPIAAVMAYKVIVDYYIKKYFFCSEQKFITTGAQITENLHAGEGRETFVMVRLEGGKAVPLAAKSGAISQLRDADGYVRMSDLSEGINAGEMVEIVLF